MMDGPAFVRLHMEPWSLESDEDEEALQPPIYIDPLAWTPDGTGAPQSATVLGGSEGRFRPFWNYRERRVRTWQAICRGLNGKEAKANAIYLERGDDNRFDGSAIEVGDPMMWGYICRNSRDRVTDRAAGYGVVVEITGDRLVLWRHQTLAQAVKAAGVRRVTMLNNDHLIQRRLEIRDAEAWTAAHPIDEGDLDAIGAL